MSPPDAPGLTGPGQIWNGAEPNDLSLLSSLSGRCRRARLHAGVLHGWWRLRPQGPKEAYGGDQGRLRVDLRLSSADADDVGAEYSLYACSRYSRSGSVKDGPACPHSRLSRQLRQLVQPYRSPQRADQDSEHRGRQGLG